MLTSASLTPGTRSSWPLQGGTRDACNFENYNPLCYILMEVIFYETSAFTDGVIKLKAEDQCLQLKEELARNPTKGDLLQGAGGFRKVRMRLPGRGKSGGARVIYYYFNADGVIYLVSLYAKNVKENLSAKQTKQLKELSTIIKAKIKEVN